MSMSLGDGRDFEELSALNVERRISDHDQMFDGNREHYFAVGQSAAWAIDLAMRARKGFAREAPVENILDYGCGCGRVGRYIRALFPAGRLHAYDLRADDVAWYEETFGASALGPNFENSQFDLIWLGSVFTHLSARATRELLETLLKGLREHGVLIFTTHGRCVYERLKALDWRLRPPPSASYELDADHVGALVRDYERDGFGYVDYHNAVGYGIAVGKPAFYQDILDANLALTQLVMLERGYDDHQDVFAFMKRPIDKAYGASFLAAAQERGDAFWR